MINSKTAEITTLTEKCTQHESDIAELKKQLKDEKDTLAAIALSGSGEQKEGGEGSENKLALTLNEPAGVEASLVPQTGIYIYIYMYICILSRSLFIHTYFPILYNYLVFNTKPLFYSVIS